MKFKDLSSSINGGKQKLIVFQTRTYEHATIDDASNTLSKFLRGMVLKDTAVFGVEDESFYSTTDITASVYARKDSSEFQPVDHTQKNKLQVLNRVVQDWYQHSIPSW